MRKMLWLVLVVILLCCFSVWYLSYRAGEWPAWSQRLPQRSFSLDLLLLSEEDLGDHWKMIKEEKSYGGLVIEKFDREFKMLDEQGNTLAIIEHWAMRFTNKRRAYNYFKSEFGTYAGSVYVPAEQSFFQPSYADHALLRPYAPGSFIATYEEYLIGIGIRPEKGLDAREYIPEDVAVEWFRKIDERAGWLLGRKP